MVETFLCKSRFIRPRIFSEKASWLLIYLLANNVILILCKLIYITPLLLFIEVLQFALGRNELILQCTPLYVKKGAILLVAIANQNFAIPNIVLSVHKFTANLCLSIPQIYT